MKYAELWVRARKARSFEGLCNCVKNNKKNKDNKQDKKGNPNGLKIIAAISTLALTKQQL